MTFALIPGERKKIASRSLYAGAIVELRQNLPLRLHLTFGFIEEKLWRI